MHSLAQVNVEVQIAPFNFSPYLSAIGNVGSAPCPSIPRLACTRHSRNKEAVVNQLVVTVVCVQVCGLMQAARVAITLCAPPDIPFNKPS